jgi:hypothetical protein
MAEADHFQQISNSHRLLDQEVHRSNSITAGAARGLEIFLVVERVKFTRSYQALDNVREMSPDARKISQPVSAVILKDI